MACEVGSDGDDFALGNGCGAGCGIGGDCDFAPGLGAGIGNDSGSGIGADWDCDVANGPASGIGSGFGDDDDLVADFAEHARNAIQQPFGEE